MDTRDKIKNRKRKEEKRIKMAEEMNRRKDEVIGSNDIVVSPFANKIKLETGDIPNPVKQEEGEKKEVKVKEDVEMVVTVEEKVDLGEDDQHSVPTSDVGNGPPGQIIAGNSRKEAMSQECSTEDGGIGHLNDAGQTCPTDLDTGSLSQPLDRSSKPPATCESWEQKFKHLVDVVGSMSAELKDVKEKLDKVSPVIPPQPSSSSGTNSQQVPTSLEVPEGEDSRHDLATEIPSASEDRLIEQETRQMHCLICYSHVPSPIDAVQDGLPLIDKQLEGIFILNKLLCVPPTSLEKFMEMCPDANPASWIRICNECGETVVNAWKIHEEIVSASRRLKRIQEQVIHKIKVSNGSVQETQVTSGSNVDLRDIAEVVTRESRRFVSEHDFGYFVDPFPQGDLEARRRMMIERKRRNKRSERSKEKAASLDGNATVQCGQASQEKNADSNKVQVAVQLRSGNNVRKNCPETNSRNMISRKKKSYKRLIDQDGAFYREDGKVSFRCQVEGCSKVFRRLDNFQEHKLAHSGKRPKYSCDQCEKVVSTRSGLFYHKKAIHTTPPENRRTPKRRIGGKCPQCHKVTRNLRGHIKFVHEKAFEVACRICEKRCGSRQSLTWHQAHIHGICSVKKCKQDFYGDRKGLRDHQVQIHGKEIDVFECEHCGKLICQAHHLRRHKRFVHGSQKGLKNKGMGKQ